jgi:transcription elongation factor GreA
MSIIFTKEGYEKVQKEYDDLLASRPEAVSELKRAREMGDLSENGFYKGARFKLSAVDRRLRELKHLLKVGKVVAKQSGDTVEIGSTVVVSIDNITREFLIVGGFESNPLEGKISHISPIGKALMHKKAGEKIAVTIPAGEVIYTIIRIY